MLANDGAAANVERRSHPAIDAERFAAGRGANNIDDGIDGPDLVKVHALNGNGMDGGFGFAKQLKGAGRPGLDGIG
jgi:hypothetical protein